MFGLSALELARIQFGFSVAVHIIFPAITVGLASELELLLEFRRQHHRPAAHL
jgi:cytochrome d ubiquinol oxidase subunit I